MDRPIASPVALALLQCFCHGLVFIGDLQQQIAGVGISHTAGDRTQFFRAIEIMLDFPRFAGQFAPPSRLGAALTTGQFSNASNRCRNYHKSEHRHRFRGGTVFKLMFRTRTLTLSPRIIYGTLDQAG